MTVAPGTRLGPYEIVARLGAGGMGEVFKARDPRLERSVAIKVLPAKVATDAQLLARFEREAKTISQLNHPHICTVHDVGRVDGTSYLVMELLEGETVAERLRRGSMPLAEVLRYGAQIAGALHRAHRAGIVHRDLKPANIMITKSGAKLLDFGLARWAIASASSNPDAPTEKALTGETHVVGTLPYMAPEQLQGTDLDARTDIFAFGAVLYEMTTGKRAFAAASAASLIASILEHHPPRPSEVQSVTPPALEHIILTCLEKDPDARFQSAADIGHELHWIASAPQPAPTAAGPRAKGKWISVGIAVVIAVAVALAAAVLAWRAGRKSAAPPQLAFTQLTFDAAAESHPTISPDGKLFAFAKRVSGKGDVFLQRIDGRTAINLTNSTEADDTEPAFSPDGNLIAFRSDRDGGGIFVMGATGESLRRLTDKGFNPSWSPDGKQIVFSAEQTTNPAAIYSIPGSFVVDVASGTTRMLYDGLSVMQPAWSPGGHRVAFWTAIRGQRDIYTVAASGDPKSVVPVTADAPTDWNPVWSPDGRHLYFCSDRSGTMNLWRVPIDEETGRRRGPVEPIRTPSTDAGLLSITRDGAFLVFASKQRYGEVRRISFDPATERLTAEAVPLLSGSMFVRHIAPSPDGRLIAFTATAQNEDVYVMSADGTGIRQLTNDAARDRGVTWWPDGSRLVFYSNRDGEYDAWTIRADGSGLIRITEMKGGVNFPKISPDGTRMAFNADTRPGGQIAMLKGPLPIRTAEPIPDTRLGRFLARSWSPDGRWIAGGAYGMPSLNIYSPASKQMLEVPVAARAAGFIDDRRILFTDDRDRIGIVEVPSLAIRYLGRLPADSLHEFQWVSIAITPTAIVTYGTRAEGDVWMAEIGSR